MTTRSRVDTAGRLLLWWIPVALLSVFLGRLVGKDMRLAIQLVGAVAIGVLILTRKVLVLVPLTLVMLAWGSSTLSGISTAYTAKFAMIGAVAALAAPALLVPARSRLPVPAAFGIGFFGLLLFALLSSAWSVDPAFTVQRTLSMLLVCGAVVFGIPLSLRGPDDLRELLYRNGLVLGGVTLAGFVLGAAGAVTAFQGGGRFQGLLVNANTLGYFAAPILPPLIVLAARLPAGRRRRTAVAAIAATGVGIALSGSRGGAASVIIGTAFALLLSSTTRQRGQSRRIGLIAAGALIAAVVVVPLLGQSARTGSGSTEGYFTLGTGSERTVKWSESVSAMFDRPLGGHGFGTTPLIFPSIQSRTDVITLGGAHDGYIDTALELGFPGAICLVLLAMSGLVAALRTARASGPEQLVATMLMAGIVAGMIEALIESGILAAGGLFAFPFWMAVALAHSLRRGQVRRLARA